MTKPKEGAKARREEVKVLLFDLDGRVLLQRCSDASTGGDRWTFPGGPVEPGEEHSGTAERELYEASGIAAALKPNGLFDSVTDDGDSTMAYIFWGEYAGQEYGLPRVGGGWQMQFMPVSDVRDLDLAPVDRQILVHYL